MSLLDTPICYMPRSNTFICKISRFVSKSPFAVMLRYIFISTLCHLLFCSSTLICYVYYIWCIRNICSCSICNASFIYLHSCFITFCWLTLYVFIIYIHLYHVTLSNIKRNIRFLFFTDLWFYDKKIIQAPDGGLYGNWGQADFCPRGQFAIGYNLQVWIHAR